LQNSRFVPAVKWRDLQGSAFCREYIVFDISKTFRDFADGEKCVSLAIALLTVFEMVLLSGSCEGISDMDSVASTLANENAGLVSLDAWKSRGWSAVGLRSLARLPRLQELDLGWR
jgi:hypothetical protein